MWPFSGKQEEAPSEDAFGLYEAPEPERKTSAQTPKEKRSEKRKKAQSQDSSFYGQSDLFDTEVSGSFYGGSGAETHGPAESTSISFKWWEYLVFLVEAFLVVYTVLVLASIVPLF